MKRCLQTTLLLLFFPFISFAQNWDQILKAVATGFRNPNDYFGCAVAMDGNFAVIGAYGESDDVANQNHLEFAGAAYVFERNVITEQWILVKKLVAADRGQLDSFGLSVAISGNDIVVGAFFENEDSDGLNSLTNAGSAYVFSRDQGGVGNWGQVKKIVAADRKVDDLFGWSVSISGNTIAVGAIGEDEDAAGINTKSNAGSVYLFARNEGGANNWGQLKKLTASDRDIDDQFGYSISINGQFIVVGARDESEDAAGANSKPSAGSAYVFAEDQGGINNWGQIKKLVAQDRTAGDLFGFAVAISGENIVVGASLEEEDAVGANNKTGSGSAYVFTKDEGGINNWGQIKKIVASDRGTNDQFGSFVAINGENILIGVGFEDEDILGSNTKNNAGAAYVFAKNEGGAANWGEVKKLVATDRDVDDHFGSAVGISGNYILIGAADEDEDSIGANTFSSAGSAYFYNHAPTVLPIILRTFNARAETSRVKLTWKTTSEHNNRFFIIERAIDGNTFVDIAKIDCKGNNSIEQIYNVFDYKPQHGVNYYRLKQVDFDGTTTVHPEIRTVNFNISAHVAAKVYPNPVNDGIINIQFEELSGMQLLVIYNMNGKEMLRDQLFFDSGQSSYKIKNNLAKGIYLLTVGTNGLKTRLVID